MPGKILVCGKGGVGKTTIAAGLSLLFSENGYRVLALDADSFPNLAQSLGVPVEKAYSIVPLSKNSELVEERTGARPGEGWGLLFSLTPRVDDLVDKFGIRINENLRLVVVGSIDEAKEGCMCPAIALAKAFIRHAVLQRDEVVIVDSEAGLEVFGRGLAERFDIVTCVSEPTYKALLSCRKMLSLSQDLGVRDQLLVINKVTNMDTASKLYSSVFKEETPYSIVKFDPALAKLEEAGLGLQHLPRNSPAMVDMERVFSRVVKTLRGECSVRV